MISDTKTRILFTIDKDFKTELEAIAKSQNRSLSNFIVTVLKEYIENQHLHNGND